MAVDLDWEQPMLKWLRWGFALVVFALAAGALALVFWMLASSLWRLAT